MKTSVIVATGVATGLGALLCLSGGAVHAQSAQVPSDERRFEVASVKPAVSPFELGRIAAGGASAISTTRFGIATLAGGRFTASTVTLKQLIVNAFDVRDYQVEGGPQWLTSDYFEVTANAGADASPADVRSMLRTLLTERFGLRTHGDTRQASLYVLTVARSDGRLGPGLKRTTPECAQEIEQRKTGTAPPARPPRIQWQQPSHCTHLRHEHVDAQCERRIDDPARRHGAHVARPPALHRARGARR